MNLKDVEWKPDPTDPFLLRKVSILLRLLLSANVQRTWPFRPLGDDRNIVGGNFANAFKQLIIEKVITRCKEIRRIHVTHSRR